MVFYITSYNSKLSFLVLFFCVCAQNHLLGMAEVIALCCNHVKACGKSWLISSNVHNWPFSVNNSLTYITPASSALEMQTGLLSIRIFELYHNISLVWSDLFCSLYASWIVNQAIAHMYIYHFEMQISWTFFMKIILCNIMFPMQSPYVTMVLGIVNIQFYQFALAFLQRISITNTSSWTLCPH